MPAVKLIHTDSKKRRHTVHIDPRDVRIYRFRRWAIHPRGLIDHQTNTLLHRAILRLRPDQYVLFLNGNKRDVRRENLKVITYLEQRQMKKKPFIRTMTNKGRPCGLYLYQMPKRGRDGKMRYYPSVGSSFCQQGRKYHKYIAYARMGLAEAMRRVLWWRVDMIRKHGLTPNSELLHQLAKASTEAEKGARAKKENQRGDPADYYSGNADYANCVFLMHEASFQVIGFDYG